VVRRIPVSVEEAVPGGSTNAYVLGSPRVLVDPAAGPTRLDVDPGSIDHLVATHAHPDHLGGMAAFARESGATVWALTHHRDRFREATGLEPDRLVRDGEEIGLTSVSVLETPGHAPEHLALAYENDLVVGDLARASGSVMVGTPDGDMRAYLTTLRRLLLRDVDTAFPAHGPVIRSPQERFAALLAHRLDREARIEATVQAGATTLAEIVDRAYEKDLSGLESAAERTVAAHLEKLAVESRVRWDGSTAGPL